MNKSWALILEKVDELVFYSVLDVCIAYKQKWTYGKVLKSLCKNFQYLFEHHSGGSAESASTF